MNYLETNCLRYRTDKVHFVPTISFVNTGTCVKIDSGVGLRAYVQLWLVL